MIKLFTGLSVAQWMLIVSAIVVIIALSVVQYKDHQVEGLKKDDLVKTVQIAGQADTIKTDGKIAKLEEKTQVAVQEAVKTETKKHTEIAAKVEDKVQTVIQHFEQEPVTVDNAELEKDQLSVIRVDGLWEAYCESAPTATDCPAIPTPGEPHA